MLKTRASASSSVSGAPQPGTKVAVGMLTCVADGTTVGVTELFGVMVRVAVGDGDTVRVTLGVSVGVTVCVEVTVRVKVAVGVAELSGSSVSSVNVAIMASSSSGGRSGRDSMNIVKAIVRKSMTTAIKSWYGGRLCRMGTTLGLRLCCSIFPQTMS